MTSEEPLSIADPAEFLAYLPHALGYQPEHALMVVALRGQVIGASVRVDLPDPGCSVAECEAFSATVAECISADQLADGSIVTFFAGYDWSDGEDPGFDQLMVCLKGALDSIGQPVSQAWWLGDQYFRDYLCRDESCCSYRGTALATLKDTRLNAELVFRGSGYYESLQTAVQLPHLSSRQQEALYRGFCRQVECLGRITKARSRLTAEEAAAAEDVLELWQAELFPAEPAGERLLDSIRLEAVSEPQCESWGRLMAALQYSQTRDAVLLLALNGDLKGHPALVGDLLLGDTDFSPPWKILDALARLLQMMAAMQTFVPVEICAQEGHRSQREFRSDRGALPRSIAGALSLLAWIEWSKGRGSRAGAYLESALEVCPGYRLARLLSDVLGTGLICRWAKSAVTAWQR